MAPIGATGFFSFTMSKLLGIVGATLGSALGWWLGAREGTMTAVLISMVGTGVGLYFGKRLADRLLD